MRLKTITSLTIILSISMSVASFVGAFVAGTYERDALSMAAQGIGQDLFNLFFALPVMLIALISIYRHSKTGWFVFTGAVFYYLYSYIVYAFGLHFNRLFLFYCISLGASFYLFLLCVLELNSQKVERWFSEKTPVRSVGVFFLIVAIMFYLLWLKDVLPAVINNTVPSTVSDYQLLVNPVHVLDISLVLPGLIITALLLMRKERAGFIMAPVFLVFIILLALALVVMVIMVQAKGISEDPSIAIIFIILAVISVLMLGLFFRSGKDLS